MFTPIHTKIEDFEISFGDEMIAKMHSKDIFESEGIELIPTICADGSARGYIERSAFDYICDHIIDGVEKNKNDIDGIFLFLHGASHVIDLWGDSGEHYILEKIREIVGFEIPIAVVMDPHGNVTKRFTELANIVRCYRESPHTDKVQTYRKVAGMLIDLLKNKRSIHPEYVRVPILIGGERCVSAEEPLHSINQKLDECEKLDGIISASYHVGFAWADSHACCAAVIVVPSDEKYQDLAGKKAREIADFAFSKRECFRFTGNAMEMNKALETALSSKAKPVFITDSGDNTTAGALGFNTAILRQLLEKDDYQGKKVLVCAIHDPECVKFLSEKEDGKLVRFRLGVGIDEASSPVELYGRIKYRGIVAGNYNRSKNKGKIVTVAIDGKDLDIGIVDCVVSYCEIQQFEAANISIKDYDIIIVKQGYLFPELLEIAGLPIMSLTPGNTYQMTETFPYKTIFRPIFPVDKKFY
jgi:microcystin degradation protein MlrC